jgi:hypothetical protein
MGLLRTRGRAIGRRRVYICEGELRHASLFCRLVTVVSRYGVMGMLQGRIKYSLSCQPYSRYWLQCCAQILGGLYYISSLCNTVALPTGGVALSIPVQIGGRYLAGCGSKDIQMG